MAAKRKDMTTLKQLIKLRDSGQGIKKVASSLGISKNTVKKYLRLLDEKNLKLSEVAFYSEEELQGVFSQAPIIVKEKTLELHDFFPYADQELKKVGVTRWTLWEEYKQQHPSGYNYSQFCHHYQQWQQSSKAHMHMEHKAGDKMFIDYTVPRWQVRSYILFAHRLV